MSSELGPLWSPEEPADPDLPLGEDSPPALLSCSVLVTVGLDEPLLVFKDLNSLDSISWSWSFPLALATRSRVLMLAEDVELS